ncbi:hypothetical protein QQP08_012858 [Theobroma cacao]|nr:hypothetical protein QQP08_012858 [Theobroma cacao]
MASDPRFPHKLIRESPVVVLLNLGVKLLHPPNFEKELGEVLVNFLPQSFLNTVSEPVAAVLLPEVIDSYEVGFRDELDLREEDIATWCWRASKEIGWEVEVVEEVEEVVEEREKVVVEERLLVEEEEEEEGLMKREEGGGGMDSEVERRLREEMDGWGKRGKFKSVVGLPKRGGREECDGLTVPTNPI